MSTFWGSFSFGVCSNAQADDADSKAKAEADQKAKEEAAAAAAQQQELMSGPLADPQVRCAACLGQACIGSDGCRPSQIFAKGKAEGLADSGSQIVRPMVAGAGTKDHVRSGVPTNPSGAGRLQAHFWSFSGAFLGS